MEIVIVGAGQAGLAVAHHPKARGLAATVVDRADRTGNSWRSRYDSLRLFTPAQYSSLPGWPMLRIPMMSPTHTDMMSPAITDLIATTIPI